MTIDNLEIEIKKWDKDYSFSSEENGKKRVYNIYSPELRQKLRKIIFPFGASEIGNIQYKGENSSGDRIFYQQGKDDLSDQLTLISGEIAEKCEEIDEFAEFEKDIAELEQQKIYWKNRETELGIPPGGVKHYFSNRNNDGTVGIEIMFVESETQTQLITLENNKANFPSIQKITDKESEEKKDKNSPDSEAKEEKLEKKRVIKFHSKSQITKKLTTKIFIVV